MSNDIFLPTELSKEAFKSLLPDFFEEIYEDYAELKTAYSNKEYNEVMLIAHKLKGSSASYGARLISDISLNIQEVSEEKEYGELEGFIQNLGAAIDKTKDFADKEF